MIEYTKRNMALHYILPGDETSREEDRSVSIPTFVVSGEEIFRDLPWLVEFYQGPALRMMREFYRDEDLWCATNPLYAINLQAAYDVDPSGQVMRYECHVDWAPTGLLYVTSHPAGSGGELVVANRPGDVGRDLLDNCVRIYPQAGQLVCFDAREYPHFVEPLRSSGSIFSGMGDRPFRLVVVMLFCTDEAGSCPESSRPRSLDTHLGHL